MFDPYWEWLEIPHDQRPPTHYQLLGIRAGERDPQVIEEALLARTERVRAYQGGTYAEECVQILNELSWAGEVLLDPKKRAAYDRDLLLRRRPVFETPSKASQPRIVRLPLWSIILLAVVLSLPMAVILAFLLRRLDPVTPSPPTVAAQPAPMPTDAPADTLPEEGEPDKLEGAQETKAVETKTEHATEKPATDPKIAEPEVEETASTPETPGNAEEPTQGDASPPDPPEVANAVPEAVSDPNLVAELPPPPPDDLRGPVAKEAPLPTLQLDPITEKAVAFILDREWASNRSETIKRVRSMVTDTYRAKGDMLLVNFVHGLFLSHRQLWEDAERAFEQSLRRDERFAPAWVGLAVVQFQQNNTTSAIQSVANAAKEQELSLLTLDTVAVLDGFYTQDDGLTLMQRRKLESLIEETQKRLDPDQQQRYRTVLQATKEYQAALPQQKAKILEQLEPQRQRLQDLEAARNETARELAMHQAHFDDLYRQAQQIQATANQVAASYDLQIRNALANDNEELARRLQRQKNVALAAYQAQYNQLDKEAAVVRRAIAPLQQRLQQWESKCNELASQLQSASASLDKAMTLPPIPFNPEEQKERVLNRQPPGNSDVPKLTVPAFVLPEIRLDPARL